MVTRRIPRTANSGFLQGDEAILADTRRATQNSWLKTAVFYQHHRLAFVDGRIFKSVRCRLSRLTAGSNNVEL